MAAYNDSIILIAQIAWALPLQSINDRQIWKNSHSQHGLFTKHTQEESQQNGET